MPPNSSSDIDRVVEAIRNLSFNTGKTNREVRDNLEAATKEVAGLTSEIAESRKELSQKMSVLADAIDRHSASSSSLTKVIILLTVILAISAAISAVAPFVAKEPTSEPTSAAVASPTDAEDRASGSRGSP